MGEWGVGMPNALYLERFAEVVRAAFGEVPYQVGSSLRSTSWRDVDIRLILPDEEYERMGFGEPLHAQENPKWIAYVMAFSALGKAMTGLPIDFQIQQQSKANRDHDGPRNALGLRREIGEGRRRRSPEVPDDAFPVATATPGEEAR